MRLINTNLIVRIEHFDNSLVVIFDFRDDAFLLVVLFAQFRGDDFDNDSLEGMIMALL